MPERTCKITRQTAEKAELLRFVAAPDGTVVLDVAHKLPGRGLNLSPDQAAYEKAQKSGLFAKELETKTPPPAWQNVVDLLEKDALNRLGLAKKAGQAHPGWEGIKAAKRLQGIVLAQGAGKDVSERVQTLGLPVIQPFTAETLAQALGLPAVGAVGISAAHAWQALQKLAQARKEDQI